MEGWKRKREEWKVGRMGAPQPSNLPTFHPSVFQSSSLLILVVGIVFIFLVTKAQSQEINVAAVVRPRHIQFGEKARLDLTISGETFIKHIEAPQFNFLPAFLAVPLHSETTPRLEANKIAVSMAWAYELIPQASRRFYAVRYPFCISRHTVFRESGFNPSEWYRHLCGCFNQRCSPN